MPSAIRSSSDTAPAGTGNLLPCRGLKQARLFPRSLFLPSAPFDGEALGVVVADVPQYCYASLAAPACGNMKDGLEIEVLDGLRAGLVEPRLDVLPILD